MAAPRYAVELKADVDEASFQVAERNITLTTASPVFETEDRYEYLGVRELPFLKDLGEVKGKSKAGGDG